MQHELPAEIDQIWKNPYRKMLAANEMVEVKVGRGEGKK